MDYFFDIIGVYALGFFVTFFFAVILTAIDDDATYGCEPENFPSPTDLARWNLPLAAFWPVVVILAAPALLVALCESLMNKLTFEVYSKTRRVAYWIKNRKG